MGSTAGTLIGQRHPTAKFFTDSIEDPFHARVASIIDPITAKRGIDLQYGDVLKARDQLEAEITAFTKTSEDFKALGHTQKGIVAQSRMNLDPIITQWRATFDEYLTALPKPSDESAPASPVLNTILGGGSPVASAFAAAAQERKRIAGQGFRSTMLTGPRGIGKTPGANLKRERILGY